MGIHHLYAYKSPVLCSHTCLQTPTPASLLPLQRPRTRPPSRSPIPAFRCTQQTLLRTSTRHVAVQRLQQETEERGEGEQRGLEEEPPLRRNRGQVKEQEGPLHRELPLPRCHLRDLRRQAKGIPLLPLRYLPEAARKRDALVRCHPEGRDALHELPCKLSCARCHSPIADEGRNMMLMYPSTWNFDKFADRQNWLPDKHIFYAQRALDIEDGMPKWEKMQDESQLMDEEHHHGQKGVAGSGSKK